MADVTLLLWDLKDTPPQFRRLLPHAYTSGWVAFVCAGSSMEIVEVLVARLRGVGRTVVCYEVEAGGMLLAGPHAGGPPPEDSSPPGSE